MGCDIHAYVEYSDDGKYWKSLTDNAGERDYVMFGVLAGVRYEEGKLFDPKGLPEGDLSSKTRAAYWRHVVPEKHPEYADWEGWVSRENAERWVSAGYSKPDYEDGVLKRVSDPDGHSHSWLTSVELSQAIDHYRSVIGGVWPSMKGKAPTLWLMILAAMQAAEANGAKSRVVFWFDN